jgi:Putative addiction module component
MTATVERIKNDIRRLSPEEVDELLRDLQSHDVFPPQDVEEASIQAEWDAEIDQRMKEVIEGKVELISGSELRRSTDTLFAQMGLQRSA